MNRSPVPPRAAVAAPFAVLLFGTGLLTAQQPPPPPPVPTPPPVVVTPSSVAGETVGVQELTRGPVHEAFGRPIVFDPRPGPVVPEPPPSAVDEAPPAEKPAGDHVAWIPGYWAWDDEARQFIWVSGFWRELPPGRAWVPGYWARAAATGIAAGAQWVSGYWAPAGQTEVNYLPEPPRSLEAGPAGPPPVAGQIWVPGVWVWLQTRYAWRPGFWSTGFPDWVWVPAHYTWSPLGYAFVDGYWDYPLRRRGLLFAPAAFASVRPGLAYTPRLVVNTDYLVYDLFTRPRTGWYYFGDYYGQAYLTAGYYPWFAVHNTRLGYDPVLAHAEWKYARQGVDWEARVREVYFERQARPAARPARTYAQYAAVDADRATAVVRPLADVARIRDFPYRMERLDAANLRDLGQQIRQAREYADARAKAEERRARTGPQGTAAVELTSVRVRLPEAPGAAAAVPARARPEGYPDLPRVPEVDPAARPAAREPLPGSPGTAVNPGAVPPRDPSRVNPLPLPEDVLRPDYRRPNRPLQPAPGSNTAPAASSATPPPPAQSSRPPE